MMQSEVLAPVISKAQIEKTTDAEVEDMLDQEHKKQGFTDEYKGWVSATDVAKASLETDAEMFADDVEERQHRAQRIAEMANSGQEVIQKPAPTISEDLKKVPEKPVLSVKPEPISEAPKPALPGSVASH